MNAPQMPAPHVLDELFAHPRSFKTSFRESRIIKDACLAARDAFNRPSNGGGHPSPTRAALTAFLQALNLERASFPETSEATPMEVPPHRLDYLFDDPNSIQDRFVDSDDVTLAFSVAEDAYQGQEESSKDIPGHPAPMAAQAARIAFVRSLELQVSRD